MKQKIFKSACNTKDMYNFGQYFHIVQPSLVIL